MPKLPTSPAGRATVSARPRRLLHLMVITAVALPLVALAPADLAVDAPGTSATAAESAPPVAPELVVVLDGAAMVRGHSVARTDDAVLVDLGLERGPLDRIEPDRTAPLEGPRVLRIVRVTLEREFRQVETQPDVIRIEDPSLLRGFSEVVQPGRSGITYATDLVLRVDDEVTSRLTVEQTVIRPVIDRVERVGTRELEGRTVWDALARCEASGRWDAVRDVNPELSYHGGLQFDPRTWDAYRPATFPAVASEASREQQILVAERILEAQGWGAWPSCSQRLGLR